MPLIRTKRWATRELNVHFMANAHGTFEWGQNDCCLFAANAIRSFAADASDPAGVAAVASNAAAHWEAQKIREKPNATMDDHAAAATAHLSAIQSFTGVDIAADFRGKYSNRVSAMAAIAAITGGTTVADAAAWCAAKHGLVEYAHPRQAQRGDLVVMKQNATDSEDQLIAGVVHLSGRDLITVGEKGLVRISILNVVRAWKV